MRASAVLGGNFIKAEDLKESGPQRLTIAEVGIVEFDSRNTPGKKEKKLELTTAEEGKRVTLNSTSTQVLIAAYGDDTDNWVDKPIVLYHDPNVMFGKKRTGGLRVKVPSAAVAGSGAASLEA